MSDQQPESGSGEGPTEIHVSRTGRVPASAVVAPAGRWTDGLQPQHLYKAVGLLFLFAVLFHYLESIIHVALLVYAAAIFAIVLNAIVQLIPGKRGWVTAGLGVVILGIIAAVLYFGLPLLFSQLRDLVSRMPAFTTLLSNVETWLRTNTGLNVSLVGPEVRDFLQRTFLSTDGSGSGLLSKASGLLGALLIPLLILFGGLYAAGNPNEQLLSPLMRAVPRDRRLAFRRIFQLLGDRLLGWVKGLLLAMVSVAVLSYIGYWLAGVPNALALALFAGLTEAIPIIGPWIGGTAATIVGFTDSSSTGIYAALVALGVQQLESNLITPW